MPVKVLEAKSAKTLEKLVNETLENGVKYSNLKFYYSMVSYGPLSKSKNAKPKIIYCVLITWDKTTK